MKRLSGIFLLVFWLVCSPVSANPIVLSGSPLWNTNMATAFWNHPSYDGNGIANVGNYLGNLGGSNIGGFYTRTPGIVMPYLGTGSTAFMFDLNAAKMTVTNLQNVTGWPNETWGIYQDNTLIQLGDAVWGGTGNTTTFTGSGNWGFYMISGAGRLWKTGGRDNGGQLHFALFQENPTTWYLGFEDMQNWEPSLGYSDWDYNDVVVKIAVTSVPESGSLSLLLPLMWVLLLVVKKV